METIELLNLISKGESSKVQFKEKLPHHDSLAHEMIAFSNSEGGTLIIGVNDKTGEIVGLTFAEIQIANNLLADIATNKIYPSINIKTETVSANNNNVVVVYINEGTSKPYKDRDGVVYIKNGSDKRKVISNDELKRLLQSSGNILADEEMVSNATINDINIELFKEFVLKKTSRTFDVIGQPLYQILSNMGLLKDNFLTLAGLLLFGKNPQQFKPMFTVKCTAIVGNEIHGNQFRDNEPPLEGNLSELYEKSLSFILRNLRKIQTEKSFNTAGILEIPIEALEELIVNSLIHRNYFINSAIQIIVYDNRIEIISPGSLPNSLNEEKIKSGISISRNPILFSNARFLLPYIGIGSGIPRAYSVYPNIELKNDIEKDIFTVSILRPNI